MERLLAVQELDLELTRLSSEEKHLLPRLEQLERDVRKRHSDLKLALQAAEEPGKQRRALEQDLKEAESRRDKAKHQSTLVRTTKELEAATHDLQAAESKVATLEDRILALMEEEEKLSQEANLRQVNEQRQTARILEEKERLQRALEEKRELAADLREDRITALNKLDEENRETYEYVRKLHSGSPAIVGLRGGDACGGCGAVLVPQVAQQVRTNDQITRCPTCHRFLVHSL